MTYNGALPSSTATPTPPPTLGAYIAGKKKGCYCYCKVQSSETTLEYQFIEDSAAAQGTYCSDTYAGAKCLINSKIGEYDSCSFGAGS